MSETTEFVTTICPPTEVLALILALSTTTDPPFATKEVPLAYDCSELPKATFVANLAVSATTDCEAVKCAALAFAVTLTFVAFTVMAVNSSPIEVLAMNLALLATTEPVFDT